MLVATSPVVAVMKSVVPGPPGRASTFSTDIVTAAAASPFPATDEMNGVTDAIFAARSLARDASGQSHGVFDGASGISIAPLGQRTAVDSIAPLLIDSQNDGPRMGAALTFAGLDPELVAIVGTQSVVFLPSGETGKVDDLGRLAG